MNTNSNSYTLIYASVMVVIVAFLLAFISNSLKDRQDENVRLDKMKQILSAINVDSKGQDVQALYAQYVKEAEILNVNGEVVETTGGFDINMASEMAKPVADRLLPLYICEVNGETKYVIPLSGAGLWGPIWGYVGLDDDKDTVFGIFFSHASETPGLGAEITTTKFTSEFFGKKVLKNGQVALAVEKFGKVTDPVYQVDGISGGTITSIGVSNMIMDCMSLYYKFLTNK